MHDLVIVHLLRFVACRGWGEVKGGDNGERAEMVAETELRVVVVTGGGG